MSLDAEKPKWETQLLWEESTALTGCGLNVSDLLKSVPVSWARIRKERDWVVPVRGCQSSVSSISLFLLRSLGMKQAMFSTRRPCLETWALRDLSHSPQRHSTPQKIRKWLHIMRAAQEETTRTNTARERAVHEDQKKKKSVFLCCFFLGCMNSFPLTKVSDKIE